MRKMLATFVFALAVTLLVAPSAGAAVSDVFDGDINCDVQPNGIRHCGGNLSTTRTFDGVPIDVNVALPKQAASGPDGDYPLMMFFHGYAGSKIGFGSMDDWAKRGYATFSMTTRGFGDSCGSAVSRAASPTACLKGYVRLLDTRYEVRDAQVLSGELVDEGLVAPKRLGAIGGSYGGGLSLALAALRDRVMLPSGKLAPWTSPDGKPMELLAAAPDIPWSDLGYSLLPNGGTLDYAADGGYRGRIGVMKQSYVTGLFVAGQAAGYYSTPGTDPDADLTSWFARINAGEPYDGDAQMRDILDEVTTHHSSYYIDHSRPPAPVILTNGWTDDLFPTDEGVRFYNRTLEEYPGKPISLYFASQGHSRGQNKAEDVARIEQAQQQWLDHYVLGKGPEPFQGVRALTQTCPDDAASKGPSQADSWATLSNGEVRLESKANKTVAGTVVDPAGASFDPITGGGACATAPGDDIQGAATYRVDAAPGGGYTLLGSPTVIADVTSPSANSQLAARLLDVGPDGDETLVARGLLRPKVGGRPSQEVFQLHGNGWKFKKGHVAKLELLPNDTPYGRASNGQGAVEVSNLELRIPVLQKPGSRRGLVKQRAQEVVPKGVELARDFRKFKRPNVKLGKQFKAGGRKVRFRVKCPKSFQTCRGTTVIKTGGKRNGYRVGKTSFKSTPSGKRDQVTAMLSKRAKRALKRKPRLKIRTRTVIEAVGEPVNQRAKIVRRGRR